MLGHGPDLSARGLSGCSETFCEYRGPYGCATVMRNLLYKEATEFTYLENTLIINTP